MTPARPRTNDHRRGLRRRTWVVGAVFALGLATIAGRAVYLQAIRSSWLAGQAAREYTASVTAVGTRGAIYDAKQRELAVSSDTLSIAAYPREITDANRTAGRLAAILDIDRSVLLRRLRTDRAFVWLLRQATPQQVEAVRALGVTGVGFHREPKRFYPQRSLAAQLVGFVGIDGRGLEGIEFVYDNVLKGAADRVTLIRDARGNGFALDALPDAGPAGHDLVLTIDRRVQFICQEALRAAVTAHRARSATAIVMVPQTGAVLALAHHPVFNPNRFGDYPPWVRRNRAVTDAFEPGSTLKIFALAAALESGLCSPASIFFCENGNLTIGPETVRDTHPYGWLSVSDILKYSSNIGAIKIARTVGAARLYATLRDFGFGARSGIDCPGETPGSLRPHAQWRPMDLAAIAFGQGVAVSAVQLVSAVAAIANGGVLMQPHVVQAVTAPGGGGVAGVRPRVVRRVVSPETARQLTRMLVGVTREGGTGVQAALPGVEVAGKTGTAQKIGPSGTYSADRYTASFVGFAPADDPVIAVLVVVDEPRKQHYGGIVAGPVFQAIVSQTLAYLRVSSKPAPAAERAAAAPPKETRA